VEKDADRPFIVQAGSGRIAAVGTAFNVTRQADRVVVTVTEGAVTVTPEPQEPSASTMGEDAKGGKEVGIARLEAGHQLVYSDLKVTPVTLADAAGAIAWREGRLKYRGELLRYVIDDVNRYAKRPIVLADEAAGEVSFTGTVFEQSIDSWLSGLEQVFPLEVEQTPEAVVIHHKPDKTPGKEM
jgi:transmembrane sensor